MGKRSNFPKIPRDFVPTPFKAVEPLIPHLRDVRTFAEPCCGDGRLVRHLESFGLHCVYAGDIHDTGQDALARDHYGAIDAIISNPPYDTAHRRKLMHRLIEHFQRIAPTWLLIDSDWAYTELAAPFLLHCSDIVAIGRVKWIDGTKHSSMDNFAWYRFDARHSSGHVFRGQGEMIASQRTAVCEQCRKAYQPRRSSSRFCSQTCRQRAHRSALSVTLA
jgi:hypothetical protein